MLDLFGNEIVEKRSLDRDVLTNVFIQSIYGIKEEELVSMLYSKYEAIIDFLRLCNDNKTGEKISMLFNPHRYATATKESLSIVDSFENTSFLSGLARASIFKEGKYKELLYQILQLGINGVQYVNEFPPYIARDYYTKYVAKRILDPCAGWGGRMIGAASIGAYYDTEIYSEEETNSCNRYKTFDSWCSGFFIPMIEKALSHSKVFIINVGSRKYDLKTVLLNNFINTN